QNEYIAEVNALVVNVQNWVQQTTGQRLDLNGLYQQATGQVQAQAGMIIGNALSWLSTAAGLAFSLILVILISLYLALDGERLGRSMINALPKAWQDEAMMLGDSIEKSFGGSLRGQLIFALIYGVLNAVIMWAFSLQYVLIASI